MEVFCQPSTFWRTEIFRGLGGLDVEPALCRDWCLWAKYLALHGQEKVLLLPETLAYFRHHAEAKTSKSSGGFYEDAGRIFHYLNAAAGAPPEFLDERARQTPPMSFELSPDFDRSLYLGRYAERMVRSYREKNRALAREWLYRAFRYKPGVTWWRVKMALRLGLKK